MTEDLESKWLFVTSGDAQHVVEFPANQERAVMVGGADADLCIEPGTAQFFYFARKGADITLVPAHAEGLTLNARSVVRQVIVPSRATLQLGDRKLELRVQDFPPSAAEGVGVDRSPGAPPEPSRAVPLSEPRELDSFTATEAVDASLMDLDAGPAGEQFRASREGESPGVQEAVQGAESQSPMAHRDPDDPAGQTEILGSPGADPASPPEAPLVVERPRDSTKTARRRSSQRSGRHRPRKRPPSAVAIFVVAGSVAFLVVLGVSYVVANW